jgi:multidrug resistance efflux pump
MIVRTRLFGDSRSESPTLWENPMPDEPRRRIPGLGFVLAAALLVLPIAGVAWWLYRPKGSETIGGPGLADLDVVCLGRIDGLTPVASLEPTIPGKVAEVYVSEGQAVQTGQRLMKLEDEALRLKEEEAKAAFEAAEVEVAAAKLERTLYPFRKAAQEAAVAAAGERVTAAEKLLDEKKKSMMFTTVTAGELSASESELNQLRHLKTAELSRLDELKSSMESLNLKVRASESKRTMAEITRKQAEKAVRDCVLLAPTSGVVLRVQTSRGESVLPSGMQPPIIFRPDSPLVVRAELEQEFLGRVKPGMRAIVRDDSRADSATWNGTVVRVGNWVARKRTVVLDPGEVNDVRTVECVIALDGAPDGLLVGQRMRVRIGKAE